MPKSTTTEATRVLIVGAGEAGKLVVRAIKKDRHSGITAVGFVDDDTKKHRTVVAGLPVLGAINDIPRVIKKEKVTQVLVSMPSVGPDIAQRIVALAPPGFPIKILPSIASVILGTVNLSYIRDIDVSDLVGRPLVKGDQQRVAKEARGKTFLVVGGAGSIGSEIVRQLYDSSAKRIVVLDTWEEGIYNLLEEFGTKKHLGHPDVKAFIGNIRDKRRIDEVMSLHTYDAIIHAAAYKHVHLTEANPEEAHKTNTLGTKYLLEAAIKHCIKDFLFISTDKAVRAVSVLGKTKRASELLLQRYARKYPSYRFVTVRFGNVLNSSGSVVPKFMRQIRNHEPLTVTHRDATRFFMSIPEAVSLVLQARTIGKSGEVLALDMGEPVKIIDLAKQLVLLHGLTPEKDIEIKEIGLRPGERLHEQLCYDPTKARPSELPQIFIAEEMAKPARSRATTQGTAKSKVASQRGRGRARKSRARTT